MLNITKNKLVEYKDFPKKGINFVDIMPALADPDAFKEIIDDFILRYKDKDVEAIIGVESRGFILGAPLAIALKLPFVPARKKGKLPGKVVNIAYEKEYGLDHIELQEDVIKSFKNVVVIDDLIATGGTMLAVLALLKQLNVKVFEVATIIELTDLTKDINFDVPVYTQMKM